MTLAIAGYVLLVLIGLYLTVVGTSFVIGFAFWEGEFGAEFWYVVIFLTVFWVGMYFISPFTVTFGVK